MARPVVKRAVDLLMTAALLPLMSYPLIGEWDYSFSAAIMDAVC